MTSAVAMVVILIAALAALVVILVGRRAPWHLESTDLGYVSQQWLAEYRASHPR